MKRWWGELAILVLLLAVALGGIQLRVPHLVEHFTHASRYVRDMFPPDWTILSKLWKPMLETVRIAVVSITISSAISIPFSFLAAKCTSPHIGVYFVARGIINICRGLPTMIWALLLIAMVGLGPTAGIIALVIHCVGTLGKYFSEAIEATHPNIHDTMDAMRIDGASEVQALYYGLFREVLPLFLGYILYYFEYCLRVGTTLGLVGAGGLGLYLTMTIRIFKRQQTATILILILVMVFSVDFYSYLVRRKLAYD